MTDTINTLTRTTDTVVREKHTLMTIHQVFSHCVIMLCCFCNSPIATDPLHPTISDGVCEQLTTIYVHTITMYTQL